MHDCNGTKTKVNSLAENAIYEILRGKILPNLVSSKSRNRERGPLTMVNDHKYDFHQSDVSSLTKYLIDGEIEKAESLVASHLGSGCSASCMILSLFTPTAQLMGEKWCNDAASFAEVTLGMMELHALLRSVDRDLAKEFSMLKVPGRILLSVMPGDTHIFAIAVLQSFFAASGWKVDTILDPTVKNICDRLASSEYDIVGLSVSTTKDVPKCESLLTAIRDRSMNREISCLVGGLPFILNEKHTADVGADHMARDVFEALAIAASICEKKQPFESSCTYA